MTSSLPHFSRNSIRTFENSKSLNLTRKSFDSSKVSRTTNKHTLIHQRGENETFMFIQTTWSSLLQKVISIGSFEWQTLGTWCYSLDVSHNTAGCYQEWLGLTVRITYGGQKKKKRKILTIWFQHSLCVNSLFHLLGVFFVGLRKERVLFFASYLSVLACRLPGHSFSCPRLVCRRTNNKIMHSYTVYFQLELTDA